MRKYTLVDKATGEGIEADADMVKRVTGVEIGYINWLLEQDGKFENVDWEVLSTDRRSNWAPAYASYLSAQRPFPASSEISFRVIYVRLWLLTDGAKK